MTQKMLLSAQELQDGLGKNDHIVVDCRFNLGDPDAGYESFLESHIPGAMYAHLDNELASPVSSTSGRHPLPDSGEFSRFLSRLGWQPGKVLVVYDNAGGAIAARLWWLMKYFGHAGAAMLDGGIGAWVEAGFELESGPVVAQSAELTSCRVNHHMVVSTADVAKGLDAETIVLIDARAGERFNGQVEPIDSVAGHIPGALNYPFNSNLASGRFKTTEEIQNGFRALLENRHSQQLVHMCGSGVTACHNAFAAELAGIKDSKLYVGSWSEWIQDLSRPVAC
jgi:thiosulfate/3-mercaptopyruvate sulfurtransferase